MLGVDLLNLGESILIAAIPALIWLLFFIGGGQKKRVIFFIFGVGCLTAPALLLLQYFWGYPVNLQLPILGIPAVGNFNLSYFIEENISESIYRYLALFALFAAMEELIKMAVIIKVDKKTALISNVNDSIRFAMASALGFSFVENIYYLQGFWFDTFSGEFLSIYLFRSIFTTCAHLIFSGIFGYYYGVGKFAIEITKQKELLGEKMAGTDLISKIFNQPKSFAYKEQMIIKGFFIATFVHIIYNYLLQLNKIAPVILLVAVGYLYLKFLLSRKSGHLVLFTDISQRSKSEMNKRDEEVVLELIGLWFNQKRYVDVIHVCERLMKRDPSNNVVKLFKSMAMDRMEENDSYKKILSTLLK